MELTHTYSFAHDEARERAHALTDYLANKHGMQVQWTGPDTAHVLGKYTVVTIDANVSVEAGRVCVHGKDPGMLWRAPAKKYISGKLSQYFDSSRPVEALPRG